MLQVKSLFFGLENLQTPRSPANWRGFALRRTPRNHKEHEGRL